MRCWWKRNVRGPVNLRSSSQNAAIFQQTRTKMSSKRCRLIKQVEFNEKAMLEVGVNFVRLCNELR